MPDQVSEAGTFINKLNLAIDANDSLVCVGLDSDRSKLPVHLQGQPEAQFVFNKAIIDATADVVSSYKFNSAFYEAEGTDGLAQLEKTATYVRETYPNAVTILDAKRADIGNTNNGYVQAAFDHIGADSVTVHPYLGGKALQPFLDRADKGVIVLCRTSNPGSGEFQDLVSDGQPLYIHVAQQVAKVWNKNGNCLLVVGATYPAEMKAIRQATGPDLPFLVPGIGAQGGDLQAVMQAGLGSNNRGLIIHSARSIIFASGGTDFAEVARQETIKLRDEVNKYRS